MSAITYKFIDKDKNIIRTGYTTTPLAKRISSYRTGNENEKKAISETVEIEYTEFETKTEAYDFEGLLLTCFKPKYNEKVHPYLVRKSFDNVIWKRFCVFDGIDITEESSNESVAWDIYNIFIPHIGNLEARKELWNFFRRHEFDMKYHVTYSIVEEKFFDYLKKQILCSYYDPFNDLNDDFKSICDDNRTVCCMTNQYNIGIKFDGVILFTCNCDDVTKINKSSLDNIKKVISEKYETQKRLYDYIKRINDIFVKI